MNSASSVEITGSFTVKRGRTSDGTPSADPKKHKTMA